MNTRSMAGAMFHAALLGLVVLAATAARADTEFVVNTSADLIDDNTDDGVCHTSANTCSLRAAVMQANHLLVPEISNIRLPAGTYALTRPINGADGEDNGDVNLTVPNAAGQFIAIYGNGAASTIIDANQLDRAFSIDVGRVAGISGVTILDGFSTGASGGAIFNRGTLVVADCVISDNTSPVHGGGIYNENLLHVFASTITSNSAQRNGGGIYSSGTLLVGESTLSANHAHNFGEGGGGMYVSGPTMLRDSTLFLNTANNGGGVLNLDQLTVVNSTVSYNRADTNGGGIYNFGGAFVYNTTVDGNDADFDNNGEGAGGGVYADAASGHRFVVVNMLVSSNTFHDGSIYNDCDGTLEVYGMNLFSDMSGCSFSGNGPMATGVVSRNTIGGLEDNGGPTVTHALLPGSEAIDNTVDALGCVDDTGAPLATDQRGAPRTAGVRCDVGSFEYGAIVDVIFTGSFE